MKCTVTVVIPALNEEKTLPRCLGSISRQTFEPIEVIVVDGGSTDRTTEVAEMHGARVLHQHGKGVSAARNLGGQNARGDVVAFTDADTIAPEFWLERLMRHFADPNVVCAFGPVKPNDGRLRDRFMFALTSKWYPWFMHVFGFNTATGPNESFRRTAFLAIGGYDCRLNVLEDNEISNRIKSQGATVFDGKAWLYSSPRRFIEEGYLKPSLKYARAYWDIYVLRKHRSYTYDAHREGDGACEPKGGQKKGRARGKPRVK